jgi:hypothetical protein
MEPPDMYHAVDTAHRAVDTDAMSWGARLGLASRAGIYLLMSVLAFEVAYGHTNKETDQRGALQAVSKGGFGKALLVLLAVGFACYALWRFSEAAFGVVGEGKKAGPRAKSFVRGLIYASFAVTAIEVLAGSGGSQSSQQKGATADVMAHPGGRLLVGAVGAVVVIVGLAMILEGAKKKFLRYLDMSQATTGTRKTVTRLGMVGTIARGAVIGLAGALVVEAAVTYSPSKAGGLDVALHTLARQPYGKVLLTVAAAGLLAFALYGLAEARWRRT